MRIKRWLSLIPAILAAVIWLGIMVVPHSHHDGRDHRHDCSICAIKASLVEPVEVEIPEPEHPFIEFYREIRVNPFVPHVAVSYQSRAPPPILH